MARQGWTFPRSLAKAHLTCGYVYQDGIVLVEERTAKAGKYETIVKVAHCFRVDIPMQVENAGVWPAPKIASIVVYHPDCLKDGLAAVNVYLHNHSEKMQALELDSTALHYTTPSGAVHGEDQYSFVSHEWGIQFEDIANPLCLYSQPRGKASIADWETPQSEFRVEWH